MAEISVSHLSLDFPIYHGSSRSLKRTLFAAAGRLSASENRQGTDRLGQDRQHRVVVQALRDISFRLRSGDRLGLIGSNGAGKTTLLRTLAGIYEPAVGELRVKGRVGAMLDTGLGMNTDLTGRENIALRGLYSGLSPQRIAELEQDVQDFSSLGQFLDLPMRFYSSGMTIRLGFALATAIHPQVLLMDEWILAGDADFMEKARQRLESMVRGAEILVLSSHNLFVLRQWCTRVIWLDQGRIRADGPADAVLDEYAPVRPAEPVA